MSVEVYFQNSPDDVKDSFGRGDDVEGHRHGQAFPEVAEVQFGSGELPLNIRIVLAVGGAKRPPHSVTFPLNRVGQCSNGALPRFFERSW